MSIDDIAHPPPRRIACFRQPGLRLDDQDRAEEAVVILDTRSFRLAHRFQQIVEKLACLLDGPGEWPLKGRHPENIRIRKELSDGERLG